MQFKLELIGKIPNEEKVETRRLVKEGESGFNNKTGEFFAFDSPPQMKGVGILESYVSRKDGKIKWIVGQDYSVQPGRGKPGALYCPECINGKMNFEHGRTMNCNLKPLRILINYIGKEKLLDITEEGAKREGFESKRAFLIYFYTLYKDRKEVRTRWPFCFSLDDGKELWNPDVWVLGFEVKL